MLGGKPLLFPFLSLIDRLVRVRSRDDRSSKFRPIWRLDWVGFDAQLRKRHEEWLARHWAGADVPYMTPLPEELDRKVVEARFAIPGSYLPEISHHTTAAQGERLRLSTLRLNTLLREECLKTMFAHIRAAFELVCDCIWDRDSEGYLHGDEKRVQVHLHVFRFWFHQTGDAVALATLDEFCEMAGEDLGIPELGAALKPSAAARTAMASLGPHLQAQFETHRSAAAGASETKGTPLRLDPRSG